MLSTTQLLAIGVELTLMIVLPIVAVTWWWRRRGIPASVPFIAAGFYLLNLAVNVPLTTMLYPALALPPVLALALTALTYGVCEETARYASFRVGSLRRHTDADGGIAAGLGHGGTESIMLGLPYAFGTLAAVLAPASLPQATRDLLATASPWAFIGTGLDRLPALAGHLVFALLIVLAHRRGLKFLWIAIAAHVLLDFAMFALRDYAPLPVFIGLWAVVGVASALIAVLLWRSLRDGVRDESLTPVG